MTIVPIIALGLFFVSVVIGILLIDQRIRTRYPKNSAELPAAGEEKLILSSEGFNVYRSVIRNPDQSPMYYLDVDDRIIIAIRKPSDQQYAGIRCALNQEVLQNLAAAVRSDLETTAGDGDKPDNSAL